jgi:hypothetical protein
MAINATRLLDKSLIRSYLIPSTKSVTAGFRVKFSGADDAVENCGAGENGFAIALESGVAGDHVECVLEGSAVVPCKVGTGGATRGVHAVMAADGFTDKTLGGGTTVSHVAGKFLQSGSVGDVVGLLVGCNTSGVGA